MGRVQLQRSLLVTTLLNLDGSPCLVFMGGEVVSSNPRVANKMDQFSNLFVAKVVGIDV